MGDETRPPPPLREKRGAKARAGSGRPRCFSLRAALRSDLRSIARNPSKKSGNDLLIAAQALTLGYTIVTDNDREFSRINQLRLENWLRPS